MHYAFAHELNKFKILYCMSGHRVAGGFAAERVCTCQVRIHIDWTSDQFLKNYLKNYRLPSKKDNTVGIMKQNHTRHVYFSFSSRSRVENKKSVNKAPTHRYWVGVINLELRGLILLEMCTDWKQIEKHFQEVKILTSHIGNLEYWAHPKKKNH